MKTESDEQEAAREAGRRYGTMAADLSLIHISTAETEEAMQEHVANLARNIREQAVQRAREGLGEDLVAIWKDAALTAAQAHLEVYGEPKEA
jgi:hypothetical protein